MSASLFFYDLETTGLNPREARVIQFAGRRTDLQLNPIGEPYNILIKLSDDVLPDPNAILVTGITPQKTIAEGITEAEFLKLFHDEIATEGTVFTGFNTIRFDDEFMRYLMYRNFYDAYEWQWQDNRSRWDILDLVRMTRALRPEGINWPVDSKGNPTNRLEQLTGLNGLDHQAAHDALSDVNATIGLAKLLRTHQPKLFDYLLSMRNKKEVLKLVGANQPFVYTSGRFANEFEKTSVVTKLADYSNAGVLVYDLRYDPVIYEVMDVKQLTESLQSNQADDTEKPRLPVKILKPNRCPAVAPLGVLDDGSHTRLKLDPKVYNQNFQKLTKLKAELGPKIITAFEALESQRRDSYPSQVSNVDGRLYESFVSSDDKTVMSMIRAADVSEISEAGASLKDDRLKQLLPLYKARNFPKSLSSEELQVWDQYRKDKLLGGGQDSRAAKYFAQLAEIASQPNLSANDQYLLEELQLYGQSIIPAFE